MPRTRPKRSDDETGYVDDALSRFSWYSTRTSSASARVAFGPFSNSQNFIASPPPFWDSLSVRVHRQANRTENSCKNSAFTVNPTFLSLQVDTAAYLDSDRERLAKHLNDSPPKLHQSFVSAWALRSSIVPILLHLSFASTSVRTDPHTEPSANLFGGRNPKINVLTVNDTFGPP